MTPGKAASQACHAILDASLKASKEIVDAYQADGGTKVVLVAKDEIALRQLYAKAFERGLPCALVIESNHVMPPVFDGTPIVTALGIGPVPRCQVKGITGRLRLVS